MRVPDHARGSELGFNMTPMIDVVFLLIIFFLVSSHLAKQEVQMPLPLPTASSGARPVETAARRVTINVLSDGRLLLAGKSVEADQLRQRLASARSEGGADLEVRIRSDRAVAYRHVEPILLACARAGIWNVAFAVYRPEDVRLMRRMSLYRQQRRDLDVKMTPMIDVVFLLLVFFIWTASFRISEQLLPSNISASSAVQSAASEVPAPEEDFDDVVIRVFWNDGSPFWEVNGTPVATLDQVRRSLAALAAIKTDAPVIIYPDPDVPLGHVIDLYDVTRLEGFEKVQFAASRL